MSAIRRSQVPPAPVRLIAHAAVYALALSMVFPFLWMLSTSLKTDREAAASMSLLPASPQWHNYLDAVRSASIVLPAGVDWSKATERARSTYAGVPIAFVRAP